MEEVKIGDQFWMAENLNVDKFRNGDTIPEAKTEEEWIEAGENGQPAWCYYDNERSNGEKYGRLYNWHAVNDPRGLAPEGWKIPSNEDWNRLTDFLGGKDVAGTKMKSSDFWADSKGESGKGTNESGFSGLPGGRREFDGNFDNIGKNSYWWTSSEYYTYDGWNRSLIYSTGHVYEDYNYDTGFGFSVRCLRD